MTRNLRVSDQEPNSLSVVVPVYCGAHTLPELFTRLTKVIESLGLRHEIIFVNDASPDDSWRVIQDLAASHATVRGIDLMKNAGQHNALLCGIRAAEHALIATMDDDLQHPPEQLPALIAKLSEGYDLVYGNAEHEPRTFLRNLLSKAVKRLVLRYGAGNNIDVGSFRIFRSTLRQAFPSDTQINIYLDLMLSWGAARIGEVRIPHETRKVGASTYTVFRLVRHALTMLTSYSVMPLHLASLIGFSMVIFGLFILALTLFDFFFHGRTVPGFTFLASLLAVFSGTQLFAVGILGLYLARVYEGMLARPPYLIRQTTPQVSRGSP